MLAEFSAFLDSALSFVWGMPLLILIMGVGLYFTIRLKGLQFRYLPYALKLAFGKNHDKESEGDISHFQSLMTALAATIGIGNIAGVATAIVSGGLGALFWMWVTALIGMATKYAEAILAVRFRIVDKRGEMSGGPMYFIERGLGWKWLASAFAIFGALAALGGGNMIQANSVADVMEGVFSINPVVTAISITILAGLAILGGIKSIGRIAAYLVPFMGIFYITGAAFVLIKCYEQIPGALAAIVHHAFTGQAAFGGFLGASVAMAIQVGVSRGLMTSEAGMGTASIAAAAAKTDTPGRQAMVSMTGSFLATIVMCTMTALVLAVSGVFGQLGPGGKIINGASMTVSAFNMHMSFGGYIVSIGLMLFAFTTLLGWAYYGEKCIEYLFGEKSVIPYRLIFIACIAIGALLELEVVWKIADVFNGLMALPNLIGLAALSPIVIRETKEFLQIVKHEND